MNKPPDASPPPHVADPADGASARRALRSVMPNGWTVRFRSAADGLTHADTLRSFLDGDPNAAATVIKTNAIRKVYCYGPAPGLFIKIAKRRKLAGLIESWLNRGPAEKAFRVGQLAATRGVDAIEIIACGRRRSPSGEIEVLTVSPAIPDARSAADWWEDLSEQSGADAQADQRAMTVNMGKLVASAHNAGLRLLDHHAGNILAVRNQSASQPNSQFQCWYADLESFAVCPPGNLGANAAIENVAVLANWLSLRASRSDTARFLKAYRESSPSAVRCMDRNLFVRMVLRCIRLQRRKLYAERDRRLRGRGNAFVERLRRQGVEARVVRKHRPAQELEFTANDSTEAAARRVFDHLAASPRSRPERIPCPAGAQAFFSSPSGPIARPEVLGTRRFSSTFRLMNRDLPTIRPVAWIGGRDHGIAFSLVFSSVPAGAVLLTQWLDSRPPARERHSVMHQVGRLIARTLCHEVRIHLIGPANVGIANGASGPVPFWYHSDALRLRGPLVRSKLAWTLAGGLGECIPSGLFSRGDYVRVLQGALAHLTAGTAVRAWRGYAEDVQKLVKQVRPDLFGITPDEYGFVLRCSETFKRRQNQRMGGGW